MLSSVFVFSRRFSRHLILTATEAKTFGFATRGYELLQIACNWLTAEEMVGDGVK
jgi:hypothetical protein